MGTRIGFGFRIVGQLFNPSEITKVLKINPTRSFIEGEIIENKPTNRTFSLWIYTLERTETLWIDQQMNEICNIFEPHIEALIYLKEKYNLEYIIDLVVEIENKQTPGTCFNSRLINFASAIHAEIDVDMYVL